jgi:hypothetical protein
MSTDVAGNGNGVIWADDGLTYSEAPGWEWCDVCDGDPRHTVKAPGTEHLCDRCTALAVLCGPDLLAVAKGRAYIEVLAAEQRLRRALARWEWVQA